MKARTRPLAEITDDVADLNDIARGDGYLFVRDGVGLAGRGAVARVDIDEAPSYLGAIEHDSTVEGVAPVALGSLPFLPGSPADLVVPQVVVGKGCGRPPWVTVLAPDAGSLDRVDVAAAIAAPPAPTPSAASYELGPDVPVEHYLTAVTTAREAVRRGDLTKAVIARPITLRTDRPIDVHSVLMRLKASFGSSYRYSIDGMIGASPELLVEVDGAVVRSPPLAGTAPRTGDVDNDAQIAEQLIASTKNQVEHRIVIDVVHDTLLPWSSYLDWEPEPSIVTVANVQHLGTRMEGMLSQPGPPVSELVRALSPTPALGGHPRDAALELIAGVEGFERGRYGGAVGWLDANGNGTWAVAIRCAEISDDGCSARLVAGGGIVADSDPLAELAETQAKFQAMLSALVRP
jgi:menaquinone-specific isochorismate synthase